MKKNLSSKQIEKYSRQIVLKNVGIIGQKKILDSLLTSDAHSRIFKIWILPVIEFFMLREVVLIKTDGLVKALNNKFSPANKNINKFFQEFSNQNSATGSLPTAEDVASMCYYLSKKESSSITGQCINIDCGVFPQ